MKGNYFHCLIVLSLFFSKTIFAIDEKKMELLEASENIEFLSQKIAKSYFYIEQKVKTRQARFDLKKGLSSLVSSIELLNKYVPFIESEEEKNMILFLSFSVDELKEVLAKKYTKENGALVLDFSETLVEGAELISRQQTNLDNDAEVELVTIDRMIYLLERISKYYIAYEVGYDDSNSSLQMRQAIIEFESKLNDVNNDTYPRAVKPVIARLNKAWNFSKKYYYRVEEGENLISIYNSAIFMEGILRQLHLYHYKKINNA